jgi:hypothetical protein
MPICGIHAGGPVLFRIPPKNPEPGPPEEKGAGRRRRLFPVFSFLLDGILLPPPGPDIPAFSSACQRALQILVLPPRQ